MASIASANENITTTLSRALQQFQIYPYGGQRHVPSSDTHSVSSVSPLSPRPRVRFRAPICQVASRLISPEVPVVRMVDVPKEFRSSDQPKTDARRQEEAEGEWGRVSHVRPPPNHRSSSSNRTGADRGRHRQNLRLLQRD